MAKPAIYIDGQEGTTGLRIREMLAPREDLDLLLIPTEERKDLRVRREFLNRADLCVLCLPDDAAAEALAMIDNPQTRVIDTSTARRVDSDWVYGLPELSSEHRERIRRVVIVQLIKSRTLRTISGNMPMATPRSTGPATARPFGAQRIPTCESHHHEPFE